MHQEHLTASPVAGQLPRMRPVPGALAPGSTPEQAPASAPGCAIGRVLVATDGGYLAAGAVRAGAAIAERCGATVEIVAVAEPRIPLPVGSEEGDNATGESQDRRSLQLLAARVRAQCRTVLGDDPEWPMRMAVGLPSREIERLARTTGADLVVLGIGHGVPADRRIDRGTGLRLAYTGTVPVYAVPLDAPATPRVAVVDVGFDEASTAATRLAAALLEPGGTLYLVHVRHGAGAPHHPDAEQTTWAIERLMESLERDAVPDGIIVQRVMLDGDALGAVLATAREHGAGLIATGMSGDSVETRTLMDNLAAPLLRASGTAVLVAPEPRAVARMRASSARMSAPRFVPRRPGSVG